jgi:hypothetical protein
MEDCVYVVVRSYHYEGASVHSVHKTKDAAILESKESVDMYAGESDVEFNGYSEEEDGYFCLCWTFDSQDISIYEYKLVD